MRNKIYYIQHIGIFTNNFRKLSNFYIKKLGFRREQQTIIPRKIMSRVFGVPYDCKLIRLGYGNTRIEIFASNSTFFKKRINNQIGYNHFSFIVKDKARFCENLARKGIAVIKIERNSHFIYFIKDPEANIIEIQECL